MIVLSHMPPGSIRMTSRILGCSLSALFRTGCCSCNDIHSFPVSPYSNRHANLHYLGTMFELGIAEHRCYCSLGHSRLRHMHRQHICSSPRKSLSNSCLLTRRILDSHICIRAACHRQGMCRHTLTSPGKYMFPLLGIGRVVMRPYLCMCVL